MDIRLIGFIDRKDEAQQALDFAESKAIKKLEKALLSKERDASVKALLSIFGNEPRFSSRLHRVDFNLITEADANTFVAGRRLTTGEFNLLKTRNSVSLKQVKLSPSKYRTPKQVAIHYSTNVGTTWLLGIPTVDKDGTSIRLRANEYVAVKDEAIVAVYEINFKTNFTVSTAGKESIFRISTYGFHAEREARRKLRKLSPLMRHELLKALSNQETSDVISETFGVKHEEGAALKLYFSEGRARLFKHMRLNDPRDVTREFTKISFPLRLVFSYKKAEEEEKLAFGQISSMGANRFNLKQAGHTKSYRFDRVNWLGALPDSPGAELTLHLSKDRNLRLLP